MMPNRDLLEARAEECRQFARLARDAEMHERWLEMAEEWLRRPAGEPPPSGATVD
jgi:hypothetical protein